MTKPENNFSYFQAKNQAETLVIAIDSIEQRITIECTCSIFFYYKKPTPTVEPLTIICRCSLKSCLETLRTMSLTFSTSFLFLVCVCKQLELCHLQLLLLLPSRQLLGKAIRQGNNAEKGSIHSIRKMKLRKTYLAIKQQQTTEKETEK